MEGKTITKPKNRLSIYPFNEMEITDSFFVPCKDKNERDKYRNRIHSTAKAYKKKNDLWHIKFSLRSVEGGLRVWRLK
jgi:hypothetical protein